MIEEFDNLKEETGWGGKREGAGRQVGSQNKATKEQRIVEQEFKDRILLNVQELLSSQMNIAKGASYLYRIEETGEGSKKKREHILVTDPEEIKTVLDEGTGVVEETYYYITTKTPDNRALDSLIDRVFGKSMQKTDITSGGKPLSIQISQEVATKNNVPDTKPIDNSQGSS